MSEKRRCMNCMAELPESGECCLVCGFDNRAAEQPEYALPLNSVLNNRYLIGRVLGQGGFGLTYIALDQVLKIKVVVKEYFPMGMVTRAQGMSTTLLWNASQSSQSQRQHGYASFLKEAQKMAKVDQIPSIVRVRDTFLKNETAYIIMDYVEGITLKAKLLKSGPMAFSQCMELLRPMMEGLEKVHKQGIIHRDISPDNIMIQPNGSVKLLDLGAAKDMSDAGGPKSELVAKKGFSPLEQYIDNGKIGGWTDVYALCATIYYCITGKRLPAALERMDKEEIIFPSQMQESLPEHIIQALKDGLAIRPENRIQSVEELLARLIVRNSDADAALETGKKIMSKKKRGILKVVGVLALAFLLLCLIIPSSNDSENQYDLQTEDAEDFTYTANENGDGITITGYTGLLKEFSIPEEIDGKPVTEIGEEAFMGNQNIIKIELPEGVKKIGFRAFCNCINLEYVGFPESLKEIDTMVFENANLASVRIPANVEMIGYGAFLLKYAENGNAELTDFEVSEENPNYTEIDGVLYEKIGGDKLRLTAYPQGRTDESYSIPENVTEIWTYSIGRTNLTSVEIPSSVQKIAQAAFSGSEKLSSITVSSNCEVADNLGVELEVKRN